MRPEDLPPELVVHACGYIDEEGLVRLRAASTYHREAVPTNRLRLRTCVYSSGLGRGAVVTTTLYNSHRDFSMPYTVNGHGVPGGGRFVSHVWLGGRCAYVSYSGMGVTTATAECSRIVNALLPEAVSNERLRVGRSRRFQQVDVWDERPFPVSVTRMLLGE